MLTTDLHNDQVDDSITVTKNNFVKLPMFVLIWLVYDLDLNVLQTVRRQLSFTFSMLGKAACLMPSLKSNEHVEPNAALAKMF